MEALATSFSAAPTNAFGAAGLRQQAEELDLENDFLKMYLLNSYCPMRIQMFYYRHP